MSALGQKQTFAMQNVMSALPPKADMCSATRYVRFVPIADMLTERRCQNQYSALSASPTVVNPIGGACPLYPQKRMLVNVIALPHQKSGAMLGRSQRGISFWLGAPLHSPRALCA